ncbi:hypothetical protein KIH31_08055 [Paenarthrobacter sp. DKR-5]|uniref:hypothetical protein n=1 Tax=Paenarthrobacter sp. DKR-5 TaxID=2835535 RepID=UPI001BDD999B|nr:hypothetical protein [Paenarthrobacter sp. DKR-5]MBT1002556.1 hypothetical protein [Paenarthrobacter sp. DKR-5]
MTYDIAKFEENLPDPETVRSAGTALKATAGKIHTAAHASSASWNKLKSAGVYSAPGDEIVFSAFVPVTSAAQDLQDDVAAVKTATDAYAHVVDTLKIRLNDIKASAASFESKIAGRSRDDWDDDQDLVAEEQGIIDGLDGLYADLTAAQRDCANAINGVYGGPTYVLTTQEGPKAGQIAYGYTKEQLNSAAAEGNIPWGKPTEWDKPWYRDAWDGISSFGKGVWSGITGTVSGLWNMVNVTDMDTFKATWTGLGKLAFNVAIVSSPVAQIALRATGHSDIVDKAGTELLAVGKAAIHWDDWKRDPAYAAGATSFDLATILLTAGGGAVAKTGSIAGKVAEIGNASGKVAEVLNAAKITKAAGLTVKAIDIGQSLKIKSITIVTDAGRTVIGKVGALPAKVEHYLGETGLIREPAFAGAPRMSPVSTAEHFASRPHVSRFDAEAPKPAGSVPAHGPIHDAPEHAPGRPAAAAHHAPDDARPRHAAEHAPEQHAPEQNAPVHHPDAAHHNEASHSADPHGEDPKSTEPHGADPVDNRAGRLVRDASGAPGQVVFRDGTTFEVTTSLDKLPGHTAMEDLRGGLHAVGKDENWLRGVVGHEAENLSTSDLRALLEVRRSIPAPDAGTIMQKITHHRGALSMFDLNNKYRRSAGGYVSKADHTSALTTPAEVHDGLRLDYENHVPVDQRSFRPDNENPVYAIRFRTDDVNTFRVADQRLLDELARRGVDVKAPGGSDFAPGHPGLDYTPNMGHGFTGSTVDHAPLVPEYKVDGGAFFQHGAEMWEINKSGREVLVGIFDRNFGKAGEWRRVLSSVD